MMLTKKIYLELLEATPGAIQVSSVEIVPDRDPEKVSLPQHAFGFRFFEIMEMTIEGVTLRSHRLNESPTYYVGARVLTLQQVRKDVPNGHLLVNHTREKGYAQVIRLRTGQFYPFGGGILIGEATRD